MSTVPIMSAANLDVGWDASPLSDPNSGDFDCIERTQEVKVDANDYSRFKDIGKDLDDEDESTEQENAPAAVEAAASKCRNCSKTGAKLKCSMCKRAVYCERKCQASDWQFHKRTCKKPEAPKKPDAPRQKPSTFASPIKATTSSSSNKTQPTKTSSVVVTHEPDLPQNMRGYKNGLPYFHRELSTEEKQLIGDIAPQKIKSKAMNTDSVRHDGSAWNKAGTFEERVVTRWAENKWKEIFTGATYAESNLQATFKAPDKFTGDASICVVRGKKRYLYDFSFQLSFEVTISGGSPCKGTYSLNDISNDEDCEILCNLTKKSMNASDQLAIQKFTATKNSGLQKELMRLINMFASEFQQL
ncbi:hypothetical protein CCR75_000245 [Bremia lactucae]|uniref:MYND-type domain-containing protein n=1 Tax=Bremia lactucae TaxID=4779 RepID=A0A976IAI7_BRELC|nr:hypothetical protein CCR75_000245 [Bremia lactucae]